MDNIFGLFCMTAVCRFNSQMALDTQTWCHARNEVFRQVRNELYDKIRNGIRKNVMKSLEGSLWKTYE